MQKNKIIQNLGIVIVNWNNKREVLTLLESVKKCGYISCVLVSDNDSSDDSLVFIKKRYPEVKIIKNKQNLGYALANNIGIKYFFEKGKKYIFILNPDTKIFQNTIPNLIQELEKNKNNGIAGPKILSKENLIWSCGGRVDKKRFSGGLIGIGKKDSKRWSGGKVDYISGTAMMVKSRVFKKIGFLPEPYFIYYEDVEFCLSARKKGFFSIFVPSSKLVHFESTSFGKDSPTHQYYMARNHLIFVFRNAPVGIILRELVRLSKTLYEHLRKGQNSAIKGIFDAFLGKKGRKA